MHCQCVFFKFFLELGTLVVIEHCVFSLIHELMRFCNWLSCRISRRFQSNVYVGQHKLWMTFEQCEYQNILKIYPNLGCVMTNKCLHRSVLDDFNF